MILSNGCGSYEVYLNTTHLHFRTKQQYSSQIQSILNLQSIGVSHGLKFDVDEVKEFLKVHFGLVKYTKKLPGIFDKVYNREEFLTLLRKHVKFFKSEDTFPVPYFRRINNLRHLELMNEEYESLECQNFLKENQIFSKGELQSIINDKRFKEFQPIKDVESFLNIFYDVYKEDLQLYSYLDNIYAKWISVDQVQKHYYSTEDQKTFQYGQVNISVALSKEGVKLTLLFLSCGSKIILGYKESNRFSIANDKNFIYLQPPNSNPVISDVFNLTFAKPRAKDSIFKIILMDPPWKVGGPNPTRGVTLPYPTISNKEFANLTLPLQNFPFGSYIFCWVVNHSHGSVLSWAEKNQFYLIDHITRIKKTRNGKLACSLGHFLQHSQETCLIFIRKPNNRISFTNIFEDESLMIYDGCFSTIPLTPSTKPNELYILIEKIFPNCNKLELFARKGNLRPGWTSVGLEMQPEDTLDLSFSTPKEFL
eukprot:snap_masked-scaffold_55-processed-gene-1.32-mRNA-1 protein AED:1.00 eAED:1.00 QI:0/-1/0/0/-1/1/1/0/478